jgi:hypothetical protein
MEHLQKQGILEGYVAEGKRALQFNSSSSSIL